jgi:hypothetical protein
MGHEQPQHPDFKLLPFRRVDHAASDVKRRQEATKRALHTIREQVEGTDTFSPTQARDLGIGYIAYTKESCEHLRDTARTQDDTDTYYSMESRINRYGQALVRAGNGENMEMRLLIFMDGSSLVRHGLETLTINPSYAPALESIALGEKMLALYRAIPVSGTPVRLPGPSWTEQRFVTPPDPGNA